MAIDLPNTSWRPSALPIYIGWDAKESTMFNMCVYSIRKYASIPVEIYKLDRRRLQALQIYKREEVPGQQATEFAYSRFLVPYLQHFQGHALFMDCDMLLTADILELFRFADDERAVQVIKHKEYVPKLSIKMDGVAQPVYPRKNWSSAMLFNCGHISNSILTPDFIDTQSGSYLHRFSWLRDQEIGELLSTWNYLCDEGWNWQEAPSLIHYTNGHRELGPDVWNQNFEWSAFYDNIREEARHCVSLKECESKEIDNQ